MEEITDCSVCFLSFVDPRKLPCDHTLCAVCVDKMTEAGTIKCPSCSTVSLATEVKSDFRLNQVLDILTVQGKLAGPIVDDACAVNPEADERYCELCVSRPVTHWCEECKQRMCVACKSIHLRSSFSKNHTISTCETLQNHVTKKVAQQWSEIKKMVDKQNKALALCRHGIEDVSQSEEFNLKVLANIKEICEKDLDHHFAGLRGQLLEASRKNKEAVRSNVRCLQKDLTTMESYLQKADDIVQDENRKSKFPDDSELNKITAFLSSISEPEVQVEFAEIRFTMNESWKAADAVNIEVYDRPKPPNQSTDNAVSASTSSPSPPPAAGMSTRLWSSLEAGKNLTLTPFTWFQRRK